MVWLQCRKAGAGMNNHDCAPLHEDPLAAPRGIVNGLLLSVPIWLLILWIAS